MTARNPVLRFRSRNPFITGMLIRHFLNGRFCLDRVRYFRRRRGKMRKIPVFHTPRWKLSRATNIASWMAFAAECRRQSQIIANSPEDAEIQEWMEQNADTTGWVA